MNGSVELSQASLASIPYLRQVSCRLEHMDENPATQRQLRFRESCDAAAAAIPHELRERLSV